MWQRKQTVFLSLVAGSMILSIFFPIWQAIEGGNTKTLYALHYTIKDNDVRNTLYFPYCASAILAIAAATLAIFEIGKFENRLLHR